MEKNDGVRSAGFYETIYAAIECMMPNKGFASYRDVASSAGRTVACPERPVVCVQGMGFVGFAMALAVASARDESGNPRFNVIGVELATKLGIQKVEFLNAGKLPFESNDDKLTGKLDEAYKAGNLIATTDDAAYGLASVVLVDIHLDIETENGSFSVDFSGLKKALAAIGKRVNPGTLVIVETTVPPGTCEKIVVPELNEVLRARGLPENSILVAHSYERVMPGKDYFDSIVNYWRVYSGVSPEAADACENFLSQVINVREFPLTRLASPRATEMAKVLENSYRAVNIAFIEDWARLSESIGVDMYEVLRAIRIRPTHSNIRQPGFGVGGYCLTKDPLFGLVAAKDMFGITDLDFKFCKMAVSINNEMPLVSLNKLREIHGGNLAGKSIMLLGVSYREDIADTRYSPSQIFAEAAMKEGVKLLCHDPIVREWPETGLEVLNEFPAFNTADALVFAVSHSQYRSFDFVKWLGSSRPVLFDANNVLTAGQISSLKSAGHFMHGIGRGRDGAMAGGF